MRGAFAKPITDAFIDIETLPADDPETIAELNAGLKPPGNMKKPETIAVWTQEERPLQLQEQVAKTALDGTYGRICAIGVAFDEDPVQAWVGEERDVLTDFFKTVRAMENQGTSLPEIHWIGHNVRAFDLRFLWQRAVIHELKLPRTLKIAVESRPWDSYVADTMVMWNPERDRKISLAKLCRALQVDCPKGDLTGETVAGAWGAGEYERLRAYVTGDVEATRRCYRRMVFAPA